MIHAIIGKALSSKLGFALIKAYAIRHPHVHLHDLDGSLYMGRWSIVDENVRIAGRETKTRTKASVWLERLTGYRSIRLHHINREDHDRDLHNHPFSYRTFILDGHYSELYRNPGEEQERYRFVHKGQTVTGHDQTFHRIDTVAVRGVWTLFCMSRNTDKWGFDVKGVFVRSARYFMMRGYTKVHRSGDTR